jgi:pimeloyl-ACP methyl ester carboxylesterase
LTVARHVQDLAEVAPQSFALVGHSFGAMLALSFTARHPQRVTRVLLVGCGTYDEAARKKLHANLLARLGEAGKRQVLTLKEALEATNDSTEKAVLMRKLGAMFALTEAYELLEEAETERDSLPQDVVGHDETWQDLMRLQSQHIEPELFSTIKVPVILVHGDTDPHPGAMTRDLLKRHIPQLEFMLLERCGHEPWRERYAKETFLETLRIWLNR